MGTQSRKWGPSPANGDPLGHSAFAPSTEETWTDHEKSYSSALEHTLKSILRKVELLAIILKKILAVGASGTTLSVKTYIYG